MPSLSFTSLDRLIEPSNAPSSSPPAGPAGDRSTPFSFYPPLYATPSHHQRPPSPTAFSPSPYVLNFKRRAPVLPLQNGGKGSGAESASYASAQQECNEMDGMPAAVVPAESGRMEDIVFGDGGAGMKACDARAESEVFEMELDKRETSPCRARGLGNDKRAVSDTATVHFDHRAGLIPATFVRSLAANEEAEFFDAADSVFSESPNEAELYSTLARPGRCLDSRTSALEEEIERRIKAEEHVALWQRRCNEMAKRCATIGVSLPYEADEGQIECAEVMNQELLVARLVGEAVARAVVRAEKEEQLEHAIGMKNREISRLWDKLQYLELVNREMSQRNQETTEITQRRKKRRQRRQKLALTGFGAAFCVGSAGLLLYMYIPWDQAKAWAGSFRKSPAARSDPT